MHAPRNDPKPVRAGFYELLETFQRPLIGGRWLLVAAETLESLLVVFGEPLRRGALPALGLMFLYNVCSLLLVHLVPIRRLPLYGLLALDMLFVALAAYQTHGSSSPFLGQFYLIIFASALMYGGAGAIIVSLGAAAITTFLAFAHPEGLLEDLRDLIPYFLITGAFSGFLVERVKSWFRSYQMSETEAREREREAQAERQRREVEAEGRRRELTLAREMQQAALPAAPFSLPDLDLAARAEFAREVGGDFYLFIPHGPRLGLVIGDVCGKGMPAALAATSIGHLLPWLRPLEDPQQALSDLNQDLAERLPESSFVTLALAEIEPATGRLRLWNAGHPSALLWREAEQRVVEISAPGPLLGILPSWEGEPEERTLEPGDVLLLYTDGLVETRTEVGELFGTERLSRALAVAARRPAGEIAEALIRSVEDWGAPTDDLTLVVCKRK